MRVHILIALIAALALSVSCGDETPTSPTDTSTSTTTTTAAAPTVSEEFSSVVPVGGSKFYSFTTSTYGTINLTLASVGGSLVPSTVMLGLGLGQPSGTECVTTSTVNTAAGSAVQLTGAYNAGVYCARVFDIGNLFAPASFNVTIAYP